MVPGLAACLRLEGQEARDAAAKDEEQQDHVQAGEALDAAAESAAEADEHLAPQQPRVPVLRVAATDDRDASRQLVHAAREHP